MVARKSQNPQLEEEEEEDNSSKSFLNFNTNFFSTCCIINMGIHKSTASEPKVRCMRNIFPYPWIGFDSLPGIGHHPYKSKLYCNFLLLSWEPFPHLQSHNTDWMNHKAAWLSYDLFSKKKKKVMTLVFRRKWAFIFFLYKKKI